MAGRCFLRRSWFYTLSVQPSSERQLHWQLMARVCGGSSYVVWVSRGAPRTDVRVCAGWGGQCMHAQIEGGDAENEKAVKAATKQAGARPADKGKGHCAQSASRGMGTNENQGRVEGSAALAAAQPEGFTARPSPHHRRCLPSSCPQPSSASPAQWCGDRQ